MFDITIAVPILIALVSAAKTAGLPSRYAPLLSVVLGIVAFMLFATGYPLDKVFEGLLAGLAASGLYSGVKATGGDKLGWRVK